VGDLPSIVCDGVTGLIIPKWDPAAMVKAATTLLEHPDRALLMTHHAKKEIERYTWPHIREEWAKVYAGHTA